MQRIFPEHEIRPVMSLDGMWQLTAHDEKKTSVVAGVPGVWERIPALARFRGTADYARKVQVCRDGNVLLRFGGVSHTAQVFWDGQKVGEHYNAFMKAYSDEEARKELRTITVSDYVNLNGLAVTQYQDYGWEPVKLYK